MIKNESKITKEFCRGKILIFFPTNAKEAAFIQSKIFAMGYEWGDASAQVEKMAECVSHGMILKSGKLYYDPSSESLKAGLLCTGDQFSENYQSDRELMLELFNRLSARLDDISRKVDAIYDEVMPRTLDKPAPGKPSPGF